MALRGCAHPADGPAIDSSGGHADIQASVEASVSGHEHGVARVVRFVLVEWLGKSLGCRHGGLMIGGGDPMNSPFSDL
jgi:hypothetical protein